LSKSYINPYLRSEVIERAKGCCEYCCTDTSDKGIDFAIDHIIAEKHGGLTHLDNLCLSCFWCNSYKGSDLSSVDWDGDQTIVPLFNPRQQVWREHFLLDDYRIVPKTATGRVTTFLLKLNSFQRLRERYVLIELGVYPCKSDSL